MLCSNIDSDLVFIVYSASLLNLSPKLIRPLSLDYRYSLPSQYQVKLRINLRSSGISPDIFSDISLDSNTEPWILIPLSLASFFPLRSISYQLCSVLVNSRTSVCYLKYLDM